MIRKGDTLAAALIMANVALILLFAMRGAVTTSGTFMETPAAYPELLPMPAAEPTATVQPTPTTVIAVNGNDTLFSSIRSPPKKDLPAHTVSPSPSPSATVTPGTVKDDTVATPSPSPSATPDKDKYHIPPVPSPSPLPTQTPVYTPKPYHKTVTKPGPKHHK